VSGEYRDAPGTPDDEALVWNETPRSDWVTVSLLLLIVVAVSAGLILATITGSPR
jgi:hypothetical protein